MNSGNLVCKGRAGMVRAAGGVILMCCLPTGAAAQIMYFPRDATIDHTLIGLPYIGKDIINRDTSPTVSVVNGADVWQSMFIYNGSHVNMSGGRVRESLIALDSSIVSITAGEIGGSLWTGDAGPKPHKGGSFFMSGGTANNAGIDRMGTLSLHGGSINGQVIVSRGGTLYLDKAGLVSGNIGVGLDSQAYISGGTAMNGVSAISNARVHITGGSISQTIDALGSSTVNISGGSTTFVAASSAGTVNLSASNPEILSAAGKASINMTGGSAGSFYTQDDSTGNLYDGEVYRNVTAFDHSTINIYGGTIHGNINVYGTVNIYGGNKAASGSKRIASLSGPGQLFALEEGFIQLFGSGFSATLLNPDFFYEGDGISGYFRKYTLAGVLQDGTDLMGSVLFVQNGSGAKFALINEVPEPKTWILFGLGIASVALGTNRKRCIRRVARQAILRNRSKERGAPADAPW